MAVFEPVREYEAPLLGELLRAALDGAHLNVTYDSMRSGVTERVIFPFGIYASQGFWYCAGYDLQKTNECLVEGRPLSLGRAGRGIVHAATTNAYIPGKLDARGEKRYRGVVEASDFTNRAGREELRTRFLTR